MMYILNFYPESLKITLEDVLQRVTKKNSSCAATDAEFVDRKLVLEYKLEKVVKLCSLIKQGEITGNWQMKPFISMIYEF